MASSFPKEYCAAVINQLFACNDMPVQEQISTESYKAFFDCPALKSGESKTDTARSLASAATTVLLAKMITIKFDGTLPVLLLMPVKGPVYICSVHECRADLEKLSIMSIMKVIAASALVNIKDGKRPFRAYAVVWRKDKRWFALFEDTITEPRIVSWEYRLKVLVDGRNEKIVDLGKGTVFSDIRDSDTPVCVVPFS